jgi:UDP-GlcNAc3NAcA epimerase
MTVVGARPQFVKAAVVHRAFERYNQSEGPSPGEAKEILVHTGQHYDYNMSRLFFEELEIPEPDHNLGVGSGGHGETTGAMLRGIEALLLKEAPDAVLVYGDTNSTLAGALAAAKLHIPVGHVESGLRSFNRRMPEEINRVLVDHVSALLFAPTETALTNLEREGIRSGVFHVGDVMYDSVLFYRGKAVKPQRKGPYALATLHRAENTDDRDRLQKLLGALAASPVPVVLPLHPRTRKMIEKWGIPVDPQVEILEPLSYLSLLGHLDACRFVITDSGGLQKEAFFFSKKCITVRDETEWVELVTCGANRVVGADPAAIAEAMNWAGEPLRDPPSLYGDGRAGDHIVKHLLNYSWGKG